MKKIISFIVLLMLLCSYYAQAQRVSWIQTNTLSEWEDFLQKTRESGFIKLVLICNDESPICSDYKRQQFRGKDLVNYINNYFLTIEADAYAEFGNILLNRFDLPGYPMVIYLDANENVIGRLEGYQSTDSILSYSKHVRERQVLYPKLKEAYINGGLSMKGFVELLSIETVNHGIAPNQVLFDEMVEEFGADLLQIDLFIDLLCRYGVDAKNPLFAAVKSQIIELNKNKDFDIEAFYVNTFNRQMANAIRQNNDDEYLLLSQQILPLNPDTSIKLEVLRYRTRKIFLYETKRFKELQVLVLQKANELPINSRSSFLINEANDFLEMEQNQAEMAQLSKVLISESIKLGDESIKRVFMANAHLVLNEFDEARNELKKAIEMANINKKGRFLDLLDVVNDLENKYLEQKKLEQNQQKEAPSPKPTEK